MCPCLCCLILFCLSLCWGGGSWLCCGYCWPCEWFHPAGVWLLAGWKVVLGTWPPFATNVANFLFHYKPDAQCLFFGGAGGGSDIPHATFHIIQIYAKTKFPPNVINVEPQSWMKLLWKLLFWTLSLVKKQTTLFQNPLPPPIQWCFVGHEQFPGNEQFPNQHCRGGWRGGVTMAEFRGEN